MKDLLFSEYRLGDITLKNRIVMSPMTRSRAINNIPNDLMAEYYKQRAGAGLIVTEGTSPSPNGLGYSRIPGIFNSDHVLGWKKVTDAVHSRGGHIFVQLMHTGRVSHPLNLPPAAKILAPSAIGLSGTIWTDQEELKAYPVPNAMTIEEIEFTVKEFANAAKLAMEAGFDGVELHAANGYLLEQFINPTANQRNDQYGGSADNRLRFVLEVARRTIEAIGQNRVGMRVSPYGAANDMAEYQGLEDCYGLLAEKLSGLGLVYIHIVDHSSMGAPEVSDSVKKLIRENFKQSLILSGGYKAERAEKELSERKCDLVAFGRSFISNPNLVEKLADGSELRAPDMSTFYTPGEKGYTDYPF